MFKKFQEIGLFLRSISGWQWAITLIVPFSPLWVSFLGVYDDLSPHEKYIWMMIGACISVFLAALIIRFLSVILTFFPRNKAIGYGADLIYRTQDRLSFDEIASRWSDQQNEKNGYSKLAVLDRLLSCFWNGDFEDKLGNTYLIVTLPKTIRMDNKPIAAAYPTDNLSFNREGMFTVCEVCDDELMSQISDARRDGEKPEQLYKRMQPLKYSDYNGIVTGAYWDSMTLLQEDFIIWLKKSKIVLPKDWYSN